MGLRVAARHPELLHSLALLASSAAAELPLTRARYRVLWQPHAVNAALGDFLGEVERASLQAVAMAAANQPRASGARQTASDSSSVRAGFAEACGSEGCTGSTPRQMPYSPQVMIELPMAQSRVQDRVGLHWTSQSGGSALAVSGARTWMRGNDTPGAR
ncbi:hypothetical protein [Corallococcus sp. EGB]|uniref:hypothetical protein n=1 Tax=Corallococcus sp. EGB TaxID=1521117 RepID=UPI001CBADF91|nr:hypothetical protein [Corallococcus sp. EGB]